MFYKLYRVVRKNILFFLLATLLFSIFINIPIWLTARGKIYSDITKIPTKKVGLLLGTTKYFQKGVENPFYLYRVEAGAELLKKKKIKKLILSGSQDGGYDEVRWMKNDLLKKGISENQLIYDKNGQRTADSIQNALNLGYNDFILISQNFHLERGIFLAQLQGGSIIGYEAKMPCWKQSLRTYVREIYSRINLLFYDFLWKTLLDF